MKKKQKQRIGIGVVFLFLFCSTAIGCGKEPVIISSEHTVENGEELSQPEAESVFSGKEAEEETREGKTEETESLIEERDGQKEEEKMIWVHVCGEVVWPGVYTLPAGSRVYDAIVKAGGITGEGVGDYLNQASLLLDGMKITIPSFSQIQEWEATGESGIEGQDGGEGMAAKEAGLQEAKDHRIDLNTADEAALCTLPGIGSGRAKRIIAYREEHGPFLQIEDIMKVSGIKEGAFAKLKDQIKVGDYGKTSFGS